MPEESAIERRDGKRIARCVNWLGRGSSAVADQGLFAGANFLLNILLARWLTPQEYGAFSVVFAGFLFFATVHTALLVEPMLVFGSGKYLHRLPAYLDAVVRLHWQAVLALGGLLFFVALLTYTLVSPMIGSIVLATVIAGPLVLLTWLARRACYIHMRPLDAALGGLAYLLAMLVALYVFHATGELTPVSAMLVMAGASVVALTVLAPRLGLSFSGRRDRASTALTDGAVRAEHWDYGRWALGTALLAWVPSNLFVLVLPIRGGLEAAATFRALMNLLLPMMQIASALAILALPLLVRRARTRHGAYGRLVLGLSAALGSAAVAYGIVAVAFGEPVLRWLYAGSYAEHAPALVAMAGVPIFAAVAGILGSALRAVERPELVFRAYLAPTGVALTVGLPLTLLRGVPGASIGWLATYLVAAIALGTAFYLWLRDSESEVQA